MAKFGAELPIDLLNQFRELYQGGATQMMSEMTQAGAEVVYNNIIKNMKKAFKKPESLEKYLRITKVYRSSSGAINTKVAFYGYKDGTQGKITKSSRTTTYKERYTKGKGKVGKLVGQNIGRANTTVTKTYSHNYGVPVPMIIIQREYGNDKTGEKKVPFVRPSFKKAQITRAMLKVQEKYIPNE